MAETTLESTPLHQLITPSPVPEIEDYLGAFNGILYDIVGRVDDLWSQFAEMDYERENIMPSCLRRNIICRLKVDLLPTLRDRMALVDLLLNRSFLSNSNIISTLQITLEHLVEIDDTLNEMLRCVAPAVDILRKSYNQPSTQVNQNPYRHIGTLEALSDVLWWEFRGSLTHFIPPMRDEFNSYSWLLGIDTTADSFDDRPKPEHDSSLSAYLITKCIQEFSRSDFQVYKLERWQRMERFQSSHLSEVSNLISQEKSRHPINLPLIESLNASMTIFKLIRMFVNKLCKSINNPPAHPVSRMNEDQLATFYDVTYDLETSAHKFSDKLVELSDEVPNPTVILAAELTTIVKNAVVILDEFLSSPFNMHRRGVQNTLSWYITWAAQFEVAVNQYLAR